MKHFELEKENISAEERCIITDGEILENICSFLSHSVSKCSKTVAN